MAKRTKKSPNTKPDTKPKRGRAARIGEGPPSELATKGQTGPFRPEPHTARADPSRGRTEPLLPAQKAHIWVLRAENLSLRQIASEIGCDSRSVQRVLQEDPERLSALAAEHREERASLWRSIENRSLRVLSEAIAEAEAVLSRVRADGVKPADLERVGVLKALMTPLRMAADSATNRAQLLAGQPTEIIQGVGGVLDPDRMSAEELADMAAQIGMLDHLPPRLRELAEKRAGERAREETDG